MERRFRIPYSRTARCSETIDAKSLVFIYGMRECSVRVAMSFKEKSIEKNGRVFHLRILELSNSILAFFYEGDMKLGTLAVALPGPGDGQVTTSSVLLGGKYLLSARALAERVAGSFKKMSLASVHAEIPEPEGIRIAAALLDDLSRRQ